MTLLLKEKAVPTGVNHVMPVPMGMFYPYDDEGETGLEAVRRINTPPLSVPSCTWDSTNPKSLALSELN